MTPRGRSIFAAALALLAFLGAAELATRRWLQTPASSAPVPGLGMRPEPHQLFISHGEGYSRRRTNAFGFFDADTLKVRPKRRVLLLGDSFSEALQVPEDRTFAAEVERLLPGTEVVNAGQSARGPYYYAATMAAFRDRFHPDLVLVQLGDGDLDDATEKGGPERDLAELRRAAEPNAHRPRGWLRAILHEFVLLKFVERRIGVLRHQEDLRWYVRRHGPVVDADQRVVPETTEAALDSLFARMRAVEPNLVIVNLPHVRYYESDSAEIAYPARRRFLHEFAARRGIPIVDSGDSAIAEFHRTRQPLAGFSNSAPGTGHMNARGHALVGRLLAREIASRLP